MTGGAPVCRQCGACCRWPGDVRLTDADIEPAMNKVLKALGKCEIGGGK